MIIRYTAHVMRVDVSGGLFNGTVIPAATCKVFRQSQILNTCDMKTDFASLYVRGKTSDGTRCDDYLFHWANGLESRLVIPSMNPSKAPVALSRSTGKPSSLPVTISVRRPTIKPTIRTVKKASSKPTVSIRVPTRVPLATGQYYYSPTNQLIAGTNVCHVKVRTRN